MKRVFLLIILAGIVIGHNSCTKPGEMVKGPFPTLLHVYKSLAVKPKVVTIDNKAGGSFYGDGGVRFFFQPGVAVKTNGDTVSGNIDIEVMEYLKRSDMIFSRVLSVSYGMPLITAGQVSVNISRSGQKLLISNTLSYTAYIPNSHAAEKNIAVFSGFKTTDTNAMSVVNWLSLDTAIGTGIITYTTDTIQLLTDSVGLSAASSVLSNPDYQQVTINIEGIDRTNVNNLCAYALCDEFNALHIIGATNGTVIKGASIAKTPVHLVVMAVVDGYFYGGISDSITPVNGGSYTVHMAKADPNDFKMQIDAL